MAKNKINLDLFNKHKIIVIAVVAVIVIVAIFFLSNSDEELSEEDIVSTIHGIVADKITCVYLGDTAKFGHFGQYSGNILNEGDSTVTDVKVVVEFIDVNGKVVGTHETLIVGEDIMPGAQKRFFSYTEKDTLSAEFETCKARVE